MTLVIEAGEGLPDAESFVTVDELVAYATNYGVTIPADEPSQEALLRRAAVAMDDYNWKGERAIVDQALSWPRRYVDIDGDVKPDNSIPARIKHGQMALAAEIHADDIDPVEKRQGPVTKERVEGAVEVQYAAPTVQQARAVASRSSSINFKSFLAIKGRFAIRA